MAETVKEEYARIMSMTVREWLLHHQRDIVFRHPHWLGSKALKNPTDAWIYQEILHEVRPEVVVEIGSHAGGSTMFLANMLDLLGEGVVVSVDITREYFEAKHRRIETVTGDSSAPDVVEAVARHTAGRRTLVIHDGDHSAAAVARDLAAYAPMVSVGSYLIVEDTIVDSLLNDEGIGLPTAGPLPAVESFLAKRGDFVRDESRERYGITYNPGGFLKRVA